jgi:hypothetical protein
MTETENHPETRICTQDCTDSLPPQRSFPTDGSDGKAMPGPKSPNPLATLDLQPETAMEPYNFYGDRTDTKSRLSTEV